LRFKEQDKRLTLYEHDNDDDIYTPFDILCAIYWLTPTSIDTVQN